MNLRWSDGFSHAVVFEAISREAFETAAIDAIIEFRLNPYKRFHDGKTHTLKTQHRKAQLHVETSPGHWSSLGEIKPIEFSGQPSAFYEPRCYSLPLVISPSDGPSDADVIHHDADKLWSWIQDTMRWSRQLTGLCGEVVETITDSMRTEE